MEIVLIAIAGTLVGVATGLVPGMHVNTLAAVTFAIVVPSAEAAIFLVSLGISHTIVNILPATFLGVPDQSDVLVQLPAHTLYHLGRGVACVKASVASSWTIVLIVLILAPLELARIAYAIVWLDLATPYILPVVALILVWQERKRGMIRAVIVQAAATFLLLSSLNLPYTTMLPLPPSPLLPFLGGAFSVAGMLRSMNAGTRTPQMVEKQPRLKMRDLLFGHTASAATGFLPGFTGAVAGSFVPRPKGEDVEIRAVVALSAINTNHTIFALFVAIALGRIRSGLADATVLGLGTLGLAPFPTTQTLALLEAILIAALLASFATLTILKPLQTYGHKIPTRTLAVGVIVGVGSLTFLTTGPLGLLVLLASTAVGDLPLAFGIRRVHVVASLGHLAWLRAWGFI